VVPELVFEGMRRLLNERSTNEGVDVSGRRSGSEQASGESSG
jgi:hypothetical protein